MLHAMASSRASSSDMARRIVPVATRAEAQRKNPATSHTRQPRIKRRGFAAMGHETLENELLSGRKMPEIFAERRSIVDLARATVAHVRLGDQRECQSGGEQRLPSPLEIAEQRTRAGAARHHHKISDPLPLVRCHVEQIAAFRFAPYSANRMAWTGERPQGKRAVSRCKANPLRGEGQVAQAERNAMHRCNHADVAASDVAHPFAVGRLGLLLEV